MRALRSSERCSRWMQAVAHTDGSRSQLSISSESKVESHG